MTEFFFTLGWILVILGCGAMAAMALPWLVL